MINLRNRELSSECEHCAACEANRPCGNGHLYVIEFQDEAQRHFAIPSKKGFLYVGSTGKGAYERFLDNFKLADGRQVKPIAVLENPEQWSSSIDWKYTSRNSRRIRRHYKCHRPDLLYRNMNPVVWDPNDSGKLVRWEAKLADRLRNRGWRVEGPTRREREEGDDS